MSTSTFSASSQFSYPLSSLPKSTTGAHDYLVYVPYSSSDRLYFSIGNPLYLLTAANSATTPIGNNFYDPNYNVLYDFAEVTFAQANPPAQGDIDWTATIDTTQVDSLSLPIKLGFYSYDPSNPSAVTPYIGAAGNPSTNPAGFDVARDTLMNDIVTGMTSNSNKWGNLALPFYTNPYSPGTPLTYLRVMAPKHGGTVPEPQNNYQIPVFPSTYLSNNGNSFAYDAAIYSFYDSAGSESLYMQADTAAGGSGQIYKGNVVGGNSFQFVSQSDNSNVVTLAQTDFDSIANMFAGTPNMTGTGSTPGTDLPILKNYFSSAFVVGLLGVAGVYDTSAVPLNQFNLRTHLPQTSGTVTPSYYTNNFGSQPSSNPGFDLYAELLHQYAIKPTSPPFNTPYPTLGLCYGYDYDDTLGFSSAITPPATTPSSANVYTIITLGSVGTVPTGVFDDTQSYNLTFVFSSGTFGYRQGTSGSFTTASSSVVVPNVTSTSSNPFQIQLNSSIYNVFPKYQFLQPANEFTSTEQAIIQGVYIQPDNPNLPTAFTIVLN